MNLLKIKDFIYVFISFMYIRLSKQGPVNIFYVLSPYYSNVWLYICLNEVVEVGSKKKNIFYTHSEVV